MLHITLKKSLNKSKKTDTDVVSVILIGDLWHSANGFLQLVSAVVYLFAWHKF